MRKFILLIVTLLFLAAPSGAAIPKWDPSSGFSKNERATLDIESTDTIGLTTGLPLGKTGAVKLRWDQDIDGVDVATRAQVYDCPESDTPTTRCRSVVSYTGADVVPTAYVVSSGFLRVDVTVLPSSGTAQLEVYGAESMAGSGGSGLDITALEALLAREIISFGDPTTYPVNPYDGSSATNCCQAGTWATAVWQRENATEPQLSLGGLDGVIDSVKQIWTGTCDGTDFNDYALRGATNNNGVTIDAGGAAAYSAPADATEDLYRVCWLMKPTPWTPAIGESWAMTSNGGVYSDPDEIQTALIDHSFQSDGYPKDVAYNVQSANFATLDITLQDVVLVLDDTAADAEILGWQRGGRHTGGDVQVLGWGGTIQGGVDINGDLDVLFLGTNSDTEVTEGVGTPNIFGADNLYEYMLAGVQTRRPTVTVGVADFGYQRGNTSNFNLRCYAKSIDDDDTCYHAFGSWHRLNGHLRANRMNVAAQYHYNNIGGWNSVSVNGNHGGFIFGDGINAGDAMHWTWGAQRDADGDRADDSFAMTDIGTGAGGGNCGIGTNVIAGHGVIDHDSDPDCNPFHTLGIRPGMVATLTGGSFPGSYYITAMGPNQLQVLDLGFNYDVGADQVVILAGTTIGFEANSIAIDLAVAEEAKFTQKHSLSGGDGVPTDRPVQGVKVRSGVIEGNPYGDWVDFGSDDTGGSNIYIEGAASPKAPATILGACIHDNLGTGAPASDEGVVDYTGVGCAAPTNTGFGRVNFTDSRLSQGNSATEPGTALGKGFLNFTAGGALDGEGLLRISSLMHEGDTANNVAFVFDAGLTDPALIPRVDLTGTRFAQDDTVMPLYPNMGGANLHTVPFYNLSGPFIDNECLVNVGAGAASACTALAFRPIVAYPLPQGCAPVHYRNLTCTPGVFPGVASYDITIAEWAADEGAAVDEIAVSMLTVPLTGAGKSLGEFWDSFDATHGGTAPQTGDADARAIGLRVNSATSTGNTTIECTLEFLCNGDM